MKRRLCVAHEALAVLVTLVMTSLGAGCSEEPDDAFENFFAAAVRGDERALVQRVSRATLARVPGPVDARGTVLAQALRPRSTLSQVQVVERGDDGGTATAVVEVKDVLGKTERVILRREDGRWVVDLSGEAAAR